MKPLARSGELDARDDALDLLQVGDLRLRS
jgi:hypothetical protein